MAPPPGGIKSGRPPARGPVRRGRASIEAAKSRTLATPTASGNQPNIGASLGESPQKVQWRASAASSIANSSRIISRVVVSLS
jgi:hypothetical protein